MQLTGEQREVLEGARGPFPARCMRWLVQWGEAMGARRLAPVANAAVLTVRKARAGGAP